LEKCPLQFLLQYGVKLRVLGEENPDDVLLRNTGTALHRMLELMFEGHSFDEAEAVSKTENLAAVTEERWWFVEKHYPNLKAFRNRMGVFEENHPIEDIVPELKLAITRDYKPTGFFDKDAYFRGVIDMPIHLQNNDAVVIDHKRGGSPAYGLKYHQAQLSTYHLLYHFGHRPVRGIQSGIHFMEAGAVVMGNYVKAKNIEDLLPSWLDNKIETAVKTVVEAEEFFPIKGTACTYCDFKPLCKNGKRNTCGSLQDIRVASKKLF
jgi:CRISPR/Cas system-associated exonuclease Cas4 (RecB family)